MFLQAQDHPVAKMMSLGPETGLLDFTHVWGHFVPTRLSRLRRPHHNALLFSSKGIGDTALAGPV